MVTKNKLPVKHQLMADFAQRASEVFKDHVITQHLAQGMYRSWRCKKPGTWNYGFDVTTRPGWLFITGDIGDLIVTRANDMIAWARGAISDPQYFAEKVPHAMPTKEWSYDLSLEWLGEEIEEAKKEHDSDGNEEQCPKCRRMVLVLENGTFELHRRWPDLSIAGNCSGSGETATLAARLQQLKEAAQHDGLNGEMGEHEFCTALYESNLIDCGDWPTLKVFNSNFLWCYQAVKWFLANLPEEIASIVEQAEPGNQ